MQSENTDLLLGGVWGGRLAKLSAPRPFDRLGSQDIIIQLS